MNKTILVGALVASAVALSGCQFNARSAEDYSKETKKLLSKKNDELKSCYDALLKKEKKAEGLVVVNFTVEAKTGAIKDATIDEQKSTAKNAKELGECVLKALDGLALDPPDARTGQASFSYEFKQNEPKAKK
jgi:outer membrane lipopolysaccharide assembly protein LptE/RlpB